jgi:hypothetical protein
MLKTSSGSSPRTDLSNNIIYSRSQSRATVSLNCFLTSLKNRFTGTVPTNYFILGVCGTFSFIFIPGLNRMDSWYPCQNICVKVFEWRREIDHLVLVFLMVSIIN